MAGLVELEIKFLLLNLPPFNFFHVIFLIFDLNKFDEHLHRSKTHHHVGQSPDDAVDN